MQSTSYQNNEHDNGLLLVEVKKEEDDPTSAWALSSPFDFEHGSNRAAESSQITSNYSTYDRGNLDHDEDVKPDFSIFDESQYQQQPSSSDEVESLTLPLDIFQSVLSSALCGACNQRSVIVEQDAKGKYPHNFYVYCGSCGEVLFV